MWLCLVGMVWGIILFCVIRQFVLFLKKKFQKQTPSHSNRNSHKDWERSKSIEAKYSIIQEGFGVAIPETFERLNAVVWGWSLGRRKWVKLAQVRSSSSDFKIDNGNFWFKDSWEQFWTDGYYVSGGEGKYCTWDTEAIDAIGFSVF